MPCRCLDGRCAYELRHWRCQLEATGIHLWRMGSNTSSSWPNFWPSVFDGPQCAQLLMTGCEIAGEHSHGETAAQKDSFSLGQHEYLTYIIFLLVQFLMQILITCKCTILLYMLLPLETAFHLLQYFHSPHRLVIDSRLRSWISSTIPHLSRLFMELIGGCIASDKVDRCILSIRSSSDLVADYDVPYFGLYAV